MNKLNSYLSYDPNNGLLKWKIDIRGKCLINTIAGNKSKQGYVQVSIDGVTMQAHRVAWYLYYGDWPKYDIDHINGKKDDNRIENLRDVSTSENCHNISSARNTNRLGVLGVSKHRNKFRADSKINGIRKYLGLYETPEEAHNAYLAYKHSHSPLYKGYKNV